MTDTPTVDAPVDDTSTDSTDTDTDTDTDQPSTPAPDDSAADAAKWKALARQHEREKSKLTKELEGLRQQNMSESEKALAAARDEGKAAAMREVGTRLVDAEVRAATVGRGIDVKALLDGLDRSRFIDDEGQPDTDRIAKWVDKIAPPGDTRVPPGRPGPRSTGDRGPDMNTLIRRAARGGS